MMRRIIAWLDDDTVFTLAGSMFDIGLVLTGTTSRLFMVLSGVALVAMLPFMIGVWGELWRSEHWVGRMFVILAGTVMCVAGPLIGMVCMLSAMVSQWLTHRRGNRERTIE